MNPLIFEASLWVFFSLVSLFALVISHFPLVFVLLFLCILFYAGSDLFKQINLVSEEDHSANRLAFSKERLFIMLIFVFLIGVLMVNFAFMLTLYVILGACVLLVDKLYFKKSRVEKGIPDPALLLITREYFFVLLIVWGVRSFLVQPYRVPTPSLAPTILPGDFILVNQYSYGLRFPGYPFWSSRFLAVGEPARGDIVLFRNPQEPDVLYVKRVVGLPGDHIQYKHKVLYINGQESSQVLVSEEVRPAFKENDSDKGKELYLEKLGTVQHPIYLDPQAQGQDDWFKDPNEEWIVPVGYYFMMGDNRDHSYDSRYWGFVPEENLVGKVVGCWFSWDVQGKHGLKIWEYIRWNRMGFKDFLS